MAVRVFGMRGLLVAPLRFATVGYIHSVFNDEPQYEIGISFTDDNVPDTVGDAQCVHWQRRTC